ncbi:MAG: ABC transporter permease [Acidimicrobiales bacterium]
MSTQVVSGDDRSVKKQQVVPPPDGGGTTRLGGGFGRVVNRIAERIGWPLFWVILVFVLLVPSLSFLILAVSPRLFDQGSSWFTLSAFSQGLQGTTLTGMRNSVIVGIFAAIIAVACGSALALALQRTRVIGKPIFSISLWGIMLLPSYIIAVGWQVVLDQGGLLSSLHLYSPSLSNLFFGPAGYALILAIKGVPFAYFAVAGPIAALGQGYEEAVRAHGGRRLAVLRTVGPILLPSIFSGLVVVFAESIADFGTAAVIAPNAHFPIATYNLYVALSSYPANFPVAAVIGWMLIAVVAVALALQHRFTRRRSFATLGGRTRVSSPRRIGRGSMALVAAGLVFFFLVALGIPILGAITSSLLKPLSSLSWSNFTTSAYSGIFGLNGLGTSIDFSAKLAVINAFVTLVLAAVIARRLSARRLGVVSKLLDLTVITAIALPGLVLAAGYIFAYNLPFLSTLGLHLYGSVTVLAMAYLAGALPSSSRVLSGPMAQVQGSLLEAARVNGSTLAASWRRTVLPLLAPSLVWAWLLTFAGTFLELPASELLAPAGKTPVAVAIIQVLNKSNFYQGTALSMVALLIDLGVIVVVLGAFRLFAPRGWRKIGGRVL